MKGDIGKATGGYIVAALGLVVGLAWNDAIRAFIEQAVPFGTSTLLAKFAYALFLTVVVVILSREILRFFGR